MNILIDELITLNTAKLAKEKGFDEYTKDSFNYLGNLILNMSCVNSNKGDADFVSAPTQSLLARWLREKHCIYVSIYPIKDTWEGDVRILDKKYNVSKIDIPVCSSYEEAMEAGLQHAFTLIK